MELRIGAIAGSLLAAILAQGCATKPPATAPMRTLEIDATQGADTLVVMLPGLRDRAEVFLEAGFFAAPAGGFDMLAADAHSGYYADGTLVGRLHEDVIAPARRSGYKQIWLLGVSLGGYGSLLYAEQYPEEIDGIVLLAPYLGGRRFATEISEAGGLTSWSGDTLDGERFAAGWRSLHKLAKRSFSARTTSSVPGCSPSTRDGRSSSARSSPPP